VTAEQLKAALGVLLTDKPSEIVQALSELCSERSKTDAEQRIGWEETAAALDRALEKITDYGM
jgi:hypothetical protein